MNRETILGFIGLGVMGEKMCQNLAKKSGKTVIAHDKNSSPLKRLAYEGLVSAASLEEVSKESDIIFLSLPGEPQVREVVLSENGILSYSTGGQIIVDCSTCPVHLAQEIYSTAKLKNVQFLDAPVARGVAAARDGSLNFMVGGDPEAFNSVLQYIEFMGVDITLCGPSGAGQAVKLMNNMIVVQTVQAIAEALQVARQSGVVDGKILFETLMTGSADSFVLRNHGIKSMLPDLHPTETFPVRYIMKDLGYALELARSCGVKMTGAETTMDLLKKAESMDFGDRYYTVLIEALEKKII